MILLVLLVSWLDLPKGEEFQVIEYFAGVGRIAALSRYVGYKSAAVDITYDSEQFKRSGKRSPMDINSDAGLVWLDPIFKNKALFFMARKSGVPS